MPTVRISRVSPRVRKGYASARLSARAAPYYTGSVKLLCKCTVSSRPPSRDLSVLQAREIPDQARDDKQEGTVLTKVIAHPPSLERQNQTGEKKEVMGESAF